MRIRHATSDDIDQILAIWNPIIRDTDITFTTIAKTRSDVQAMCDRVEPLLVAIRDGSLLGFASFAAFRGGPGYAHTAEHTIHLAPGAQRNGVGRALLSDLEDAARAQDLHCLIAAISATNAPARAFHAACGYVECGTLPEVGTKFGKRLDLVLMQKLL